jgi:hypothetical protein
MSNRLLCVLQWKNVTEESIPVGEEALRAGTNTALCSCWTVRQGPRFSVASVLIRFKVQTHLL